MSNKITYNVGFNVDSSTLTNLRSELNKIQQMSLSQFKVIDSKASIGELKQIQSVARQVGVVLENSFNPKLNSINVAEFNQKLAATGLTLQQVSTAFNAAGNTGKRAFQQLSTELLTSQKQLRETHGLLSKMGETLGNTIKWSLASGAINLFTGTVRQAWGYTKALDSSLNDIRIVTEKSAEEMERFAKNANRAAKGLGTATTEYTKASLIYYQQGLDESDVKARTAATVKAANVTGQSAAEVSEQLTAVWNGYKVVAEEAEGYVDKLAAVAASTAADLEELSTGMSKVASAANAMGVDIDQLSAQLSTIISVTRQDAASVGTALKTIYARMGDLSVDGVDEFGTSLGDVSGQMRQMGVEVLDQQGNLKDMGEVIEEVAKKWGTWTDAQQQAAAVAIAGKRQYNNLMALFENWDMYESAMGTSQNAEGTLQKQQDIYMDSIEAHMEQLSVAGERVYDALFDSESMKDTIDGLTVIVEGFANLVEAIGGGGNALMMLGGIAGRVLGPQIGSFVGTWIRNQQNLRYNITQTRAELEVLHQLENTNAPKEQRSMERLIELKKQQLMLEGKLTEAQRAQNNEHLKRVAESLRAQEEVEDSLNVLNEQYQEMQGTKDTKNKTRKTIDFNASGLEGVSSDIEDEAEQNVTTTQKQVDKVTNKGKLLQQERQDLENDLAFASGEMALTEDGLLTEGTEDTKKVLELKQKIKDIDDQIALQQKELTEAEKEHTNALEAQKRIKENQVDLNTAISETQNIASFSADLTDSTKRAAGYTADIQEYDKQTAAYQKQYGVSGDIDFAAEAQKIQKDKNDPSKNQKEVEKQAKALKKLQQAQEKATAAQKHYKAAGQDVAKMLKDVTSGQDKNTKLTQAAQNAIIKVKTENTLFSQALDKVAKGETLTAQEAAAYKKGLEDIEAAARESADQADELTQALSQQKAQIDKNNDAIKENEQALEDTLSAQKAEQMASNVTQVVGGLTALAGSIQTVANMGDIWQNQDMSTGEKVLQTIMAILGVLGSVITVVPIIQTLIKATGKTTQTELATTGATGTTAGVSIQVAFWPILLITLAIVAALGVAILLFKLFSKDSETAAEKSAKALESASEQAKKLNEELKETKEEYKTLLDEMSNYKDAKLALDQLRVGTDEWKEAVADLNNQVLELVTKYPTLLEFMERDSNGVLSISQEGWDQVIKQQQQQVADAQSNALYGQLVLKNATAHDMKVQYSDSESGGDVVDAVSSKLMEDSSYLKKQDIDFQKFAENIYRQQYLESVGAYEEGAQYYATDEHGRYQYDENGSVIRKEYDAQSRELLWNNYIERNKDAYGEDYNPYESARVFYGTNLDQIKADEFGIDKEIIDGILANKDFWEDNVFANTEELAKALEESYNGMEDLAEKLSANTRATNQLEIAYMTSLGEKWGIKDSDTFGKLSMKQSDIEGTDAYKDALADAGKQMWNQYFESDAGSDETNDEDALKSSATDLIKATYGDDAVISDMQEDWSKIEGVDSFKENFKVTVNGEEVTGEDLVTQFGADYIEQVLKKENDALLEEMTKYEKAGINTKAAYFSNDRYDKKLTDSGNLTLADIAEITAYGNTSQADEAIKDNVAAYQKEFEKERNTYLQNTGLISTAEDGTTTVAGGLENFSLTDFKNLQNSVANAELYGGGDAIRSLLQSYAGDGAALEAINKGLAGMKSWDPASIQTFLTGLAEQGIIIDDTNVAWDNFMDDVYDGTKQWISNSQGVIDNLATIKELTEDIKVGDILSEEDYKRLLAVSPEIANMFIKTADGYKALAGSNELDKVLKKQYQSLGELKSFYTDVSAEIQKLDKTGNIGLDLSTSDSATSYIQSFVEDPSKYSNLIEYAGGDQERLATAYSKVLGADDEYKKTTEYDQYLQYLQTIGQNINQALLDNENGELNSREGQEIWATEIASSWGEIEANKANLDEDIYNKAETMWKNEYLTQMGFNGDYKTALGASELENHLKNIRELELDYFKDINYELDKLGKIIETSFGDDKFSALTAQKDLKASASSRANEEANMAKNTFDAMFTDFLVNNTEALGVEASSLVGADGGMKLSAMNDLLVNTTDESAKENIQAIIDMWSQMEEKSAEATNAAYDLIDAQIEAFKYGVDTALELEKIEKEWDSFSQQFAGIMNYKQGTAGSLNVFGKQSAADSIQNAFTNVAKEEDTFNILAGQLGKMEHIADTFSSDNALMQVYDAAADVTQAKREAQAQATQNLAEKQDELTTANENLAGAEATLSGFTDAYEKSQSAIDAAKTSEETLAKQRDAAQKAIDDVNAIYDIAALEEAEAAALTKQTNAQATKDKKDNKDNQEALEKAQEEYNAANAAAEEARKAMAKATEGGTPEEIEAKRAAAAEALAAAEAAQKSLLAEYSDYGSTYDEIVKTMSGNVEEMKGKVTSAQEAVASAETGLATANTELATAIGDQKDAAQAVVDEVGGAYAAITENGTLVWDSEQFKDDWSEYLSQAQDSLEAMQGELQNLYDGYLAAQDEMMGLYDTEINKLKSINSILKAGSDLWKMIGKHVKNSTVDTSTYYSQITTNASKSLELAKEKLETAQIEFSKLTDDASDEMRQKVTDNLAAASEEVLAASSEMATAISEQFSEGLSRAFDSFVKSGAISGLENVTEEWGMATRKDEQYLDDVNANYNISNLERDFQKSIDATDSITAQKKLNSVMQEQLKILREKDKLSQYDIDRANAMYDLTLKQIALEEAQQTANKMKLTRDASGNYTYQYVQDQDAVAQAEADLAAAENDLYNMDKDRNKELVDEYYSTMSEANSSIAEAIAAGDTARAERLKQHYFGPDGLLTGIQSELGVAEENLQAMGESLAGTDWTSSFSNFTNAITESNLGDLATNIDTLMSTAKGSFEELGKTVNSLYETKDGVAAPLVAATTALTNSVKAAEAIDTTKLMDSTQQVLDKLPGLTSRLSELTKELDGYGSSYQQWLQSQGSEISANTAALVENTEAIKNRTTDSMSTIANPSSTDTTNTNADGEANQDAN